MFAAFVVFAIAAIIWSLALLPFMLLRRSRRARWLFFIASFFAAVAAAFSIASDIHVLLRARDARAADLAIRITQRGDWFELDYSRPGTSFTTANEIHVPAGAAVRLTTAGVQAALVDVDGAACLPMRRREYLLITDRATSGEARFAALWPPAWRRLRLVVDRPERFEPWFENEARPAVTAGEGAFLFVNSGCGYCHVIRGVSSSPSTIAPDLTHFASRRTIAGTSIPIGRGALTGWVVHSRGIKPHSGMPDNALDPRALHPLVGYLESLR